MKFCSKCGAQCVDEAVICVSCGSPVAAPVASNPVFSNPAAYKPNVNIPQTKPEKSNDNKLAIFDFLSNLSLLFYTACAFLSVVYAYVWEGYYSTFWEFDELFLIISCVLAVPVLIFGFIRFILGLTQKGDLNSKLSGIFRFITAIVIVVVSVLALIEHL